MKVSYQGKVRGIHTEPASIDELRKVVSNKFTERNLIEDTQTMSSILDS